jgi:hypothetical protein
MTETTTETTTSFTATHEITVTDRDTGAVKVIPVALVDGVAYTRVEWDACAPADWEYDAGSWTFQGRAVPAVRDEVTVRTL